MLLLGKFSQKLCILGLVFLLLPMNLLDHTISFSWSCFVDSQQMALDSFSILDLFFVFSLDVGETSVLVMVCVIFCAVGLLLIEES